MDGVLERIDEDEEVVDEEEDKSGVIEEGNMMEDGVYEAAM